MYDLQLLREFIIHVIERIINETNNHPDNDVLITGLSMAELQIRKFNSYVNITIEANTNNR
jgi:hypothetical protein